MFKSIKHSFVCKMQLLLNVHEASSHAACCVTLRAVQCTISGSHAIPLLLFLCSSCID